MLHLFMRLGYQNDIIMLFKPTRMQYIICKTRMQYIICKICNAINIHHVGYIVDYTVLHNLLSESVLLVCDFELHVHCN